MPKEIQVSGHECANSLKIPLIVGVSGHCDILTSESEIEKGMRAFWNKIQKIVDPNTPIILLSSIAQGADHLAVKYRPENMPYCVVLPFDENEYRKDFPGTTLNEFEKDFQDAYKIIRCEANPRDYTVASDYVRKHSDILLTLWDGYESLDSQSGKVEQGGTYYQIRAAFGMDDLLLQHQEKTHLIVNIPVIRSKKGIDYHQKHVPEEKQISEYNKEALSVIEKKNGIKGLCFTPLEEFKLEENSNISNPETETQPSFASTLKFLRIHNANLPSEPIDICGPYDKLKDFPQAQKIAKIDYIRYKYFDGLALSHQTPHKKQFFWIAFFSVFVGILGQAWGDLTFSADDKLHEWIMHGVILLYLLGCIGVFWFGRKIAKEDHYSHYLQPRIIAELLRLKIFWMLAGIKESFTEYILEEGANYQFMLPLCNWEVAGAPLIPEDQKWLENGKGLNAVKSCWLEDQAGYYSGYLLPQKDVKDTQKRFLSPAWFREEIEKCKWVILPHQGERCRKEHIFSRGWFRQYFKKYERLEGYSSFCKTFFTWCGFFLAAILILVFLFAQIFHFDHTEILALSWYREFIVGICPFIVATLGWLLEKNNWDSLGLQYRNTLNLFQKTIAFIGEEHPLAKKQQIIKELMLFAHQENAKWDEIRKNSKPEPMA